MRRKIYTKKESILFEPDILGLIVVVFFCAVMTNVDQNNGVFYLMYLILIGLWIWKTVEALHSRKKHKKCVETQIPQKGQIVDCICETIYHRRARGSYTEYRYYLIVEMYIIPIRNRVIRWMLFNINLIKVSRIFCRNCSENPYLARV